MIFSKSYNMTEDEYRTKEKVEKLWKTFEAEWNSLPKEVQEELLRLEAEFEEYEHETGEIRLRRVSKSTE